MVTMALGAVVLVALPAGAKSISYSHFSGPGLPPEGVTIRARHEALPDTGLVGPKGVPPSELGLSRRDLGPAYSAEYRMDYAPDVPLHQVVYPYAEGGPWTFTPRGQHIGQDHRSFRGGWYEASPDLLSFLIAHGFPEPTSAGTMESGTKQAARTGALQTSSGAWRSRSVLPGVVALVSLLLAVLVARRIQRVP